MVRSGFGGEYKTRNWEFGECSMLNSQRSMFNNEKEIEIDKHSYDGVLFLL